MTFEYAETLLDEGGIDIYNTFTHIDMRATNQDGRANKPCYFIVYILTKFVNNGKM